VYTGKGEVQVNTANRSSTGVFDYMSSTGIHEYRTSTG
jgi:hypothetical protein